MTASPVSLSAPVSLPALALGKGKNPVAVDSARLQNSPQQNEFEQAFHALLSPKENQAGSQAKKTAGDNATGNSGSPDQPHAPTTTKNKQPAKNTAQDTSAAANGDSVDLSHDAADAAQAVSTAAVFAHNDQPANSVATTAGTTPDPLPSSPAGAPAITSTVEQGSAPALALRVKTDSETSDNAEQPESGLDISSQSLLTSLDGKPGAGSKDTHEDDGQHHESGAPADAMPSASAHNANRAEPEAAATEGTSSAHSLDFEAELAKYRSEPVRGAHVQIAGSGDQRVDIRLIEHSGTLSVTVRSSDHVLARSLQEQAPELHARLAGEHYRSELWAPTAAKTSEMRDGATGQGEANREGQRGSARENQNRQNSKQNQQPGWLENFEQQAKSIQSRIEYTWHQ